LLNYCGRNFTDDVTTVGGVSLMMNSRVGGADLPKSKVSFTEFVFIINYTCVAGVVCTSLTPALCSGKLMTGH